MEINDHELLGADWQPDENDRGTFFQINDTNPLITFAVIVEELENSDDNEAITSLTLSIEYNDGDGSVPLAQFSGIGLPKLNEAVAAAKELCDKIVPNSAACTGGNLIALSIRLNEMFDIEGDNYADDYDEILADFAAARETLGPDWTLTKLPDNTPGLVKNFPHDFHAEVYAVYIGADDENDETIPFANVGIIAGGDPQTSNVICYIWNIALNRVNEEIEQFFTKLCADDNAGDCLSAFLSAMELDFQTETDDEYSDAGSEDFTACNGCENCDNYRNDEYTVSRDADGNLTFVNTTGIKNTILRLLKFSEKRKHEAENNAATENS